MCPEYGATVAIFPIDDMTLEYLRLTGRDAKQIALVEAYAKAQGLFRTADSPDAIYSETMELDLATVEPSLAGPRRPQDRVPLSKAKTVVRRGARRIEEGRQDPGRRWRNRRRHRDAARTRLGRDRRDHELHQHLEPERDDRRRPGREEGGRARPDAQAVGEDQPGAGIEGRHRLPEEVRPRRVSRSSSVSTWSATAAPTCIGNSGPLPDEISAEINERGLVVASVLSGNRNFEGRIQQDVRANLPGVAAAGRRLRAGRHDEHRPVAEPLGTGSDGKPVYLKDIWPTEKEIQQAMLASVTSAAFRQQYASVFDGDVRWQKLPVPIGDRFAWEGSSTYVRKPPFLEGVYDDAGAAGDLREAARWRCSATASPPITSRRPATSRRTARRAST